MPDYYPPNLTERSYALYGKIKAWALGRRGGLTLVGGWAVYELVEMQVAIRSRDVDVVLHDAASLRAFNEQLPAWKLVWHEGRIDEGIGCKFEEDKNQRPEVLVDVFTGVGFGYDIEGVPKKAITKTLRTREFLPSLPELLNDKVETVPSRQGRDAYDKQAKDLLDVHSLVFFNRAGRPPAELLDYVPRAKRREAAYGRIDRSVKLHPEYEREYREVEAWLTR